MDQDCKCKRARFIDNSVSIRETFHFAKPDQILKAVQVYCCDFYGSMLWNLYGEQANQLFRSWNTCTKLVWGLPRQTHSYFVDRFLSCGMPSIRSQILSRYAKFVRSLLSSPSKEVAVVARVSATDVSSNTGLNLLNFKLESNLCAVTSPIMKIKEFLFRPMPVPESDEWRIAVLSSYLETRNSLKSSLSNTEFIDNLIDSLCST